MARPSIAAMSFASSELARYQRTVSALKYSATHDSGLSFDTRGEVAGLDARGRSRRYERQASSFGQQQASIGMSCRYREQAICSSPDLRTG